MHKICFFVPVGREEPVKAAMFEAGAGRIGNYDRCCWQTLGQGQFRPLPGSHPAIGELQRLQTLPELKVEMICDDEHLEAAIQALLRTHPYETPAYEHWRIQDEADT